MNEEIIKCFDEIKEEMKACIRKKYGDRVHMYYYLKESMDYIILRIAKLELEIENLNFKGKRLRT